MLIRLFLFLIIVQTAFQRQKPDKNVEIDESKALFFPLMKISPTSKLASYAELYLGDFFKKQLFLIDIKSPISTVTIKKDCVRCGIHEYETYSKKNMDFIDCKTGICKELSGKCGAENKCEFNSENITFKGFFYPEKINGLYNFAENYKDKIEIPFGATTIENEKMFENKANGIIGLKNSKEGIVNILHQNKLINSKKFSICKGSEYDGFLLFGEIKVNKKFKKERGFEMNNKAKGLYTFDLNSIFMQSTSIKIDNDKTLVYIDPNSIYSYFPKNIYDQLFASFQRSCRREKVKCGKIFNTTTNDAEYYKENSITHCFKLSDDKLSDREIFKIMNKWPTINFGFPNGNIFKWQVKNYIFPLEKDNYNTVCLGFIKGSDDSNIILGSNFIQNNRFTFDLDANTISYTKSDCSIESLKKCTVIDTAYIRIKQALVLPLQILCIILFTGVVIMLCVILCVKNGENCQKPKFNIKKNKDSFKKAKIIKEVKSVVTPDIQ